MYSPRVEDLSLSALYPSSLKCSSESSESSVTQWWSRKWLPQAPETRTSLTLMEGWCWQSLTGVMLLSRQVASSDVFVLSPTLDWRALNWQVWCCSLAKLPHLMCSCSPQPWTDALSIDRCDAALSPSCLIWCVRALPNPGLTRSQLTGVNAALSPSASSDVFVLSPNPGLTRFNWQVWCCSLAKLPHLMCSCSPQPWTDALSIDRCECCSLAKCLIWCVRALSQPWTDALQLTGVALTDGRMVLTVPDRCDAALSPSCLIWCVCALSQPWTDALSIDRCECCSLAKLPHLMCSCSLPTLDWRALNWQVWCCSLTKLPHLMCSCSPQPWTDALSIDRCDAALSPSASSDVFVLSPNPGLTRFNWQVWCCSLAKLPHMMCSCSPQPWTDALSIDRCDAALSPSCLIWCVCALPNPGLTRSQLTGVMLLSRQVASSDVFVLSPTLDWRALNWQVWMLLSRQVPHLMCSCSLPTLDWRASIDRCDAALSPRNLPHLMCSCSPQPWTDALSIDRCECCSLDKCLIWCVRALSQPWTDALQLTGVALTDGSLRIGSYLVTSPWNCQEPRSPRTPGVGSCSLSRTPSNPTSIYITSLVTVEQLTRSPPPSRSRSSLDLTGRSLDSRNSESGHQSSIVDSLYVCQVTICRSFRLSSRSRVLAWLLCPIDLLDAPGRATAPALPSSRLPRVAPKSSQSIPWPAIVFYTNKTILKMISTVFSSSA